MNSNFICCYKEPCDYYEPRSCSCEMLSSDRKKYCPHEDSIKGGVIMNKKLNDRVNAILAMRNLHDGLIDFIESQTNIKIYKDDTGFYLRGEISADNLTLKQLTALLTAVADEVSSNEA